MGGNPQEGQGSAVLNYYQLLGCVDGKVQYSSRVKTGAQ